MNRGKVAEGKRHMEADTGITPLLTWKPGESEASNARKPSLKARREYDPAHNLILDL